MSYEKQSVRIKKLKTERNAMSETVTAAKPHHYQLRDKSKKTYLTNDDLYPDREDAMGDQVVICFDEEKAHDLRFKYEQEFRVVGADEVEIEVVCFAGNGQEISVS